MLLGVPGCGVDQSKSDAPERFVPSRPDQIERAVIYPEAATARLFVTRPYEEGMKEDFQEPEGRLLTAEDRRAVEGNFRIVTVWDMDPNATAAACFVPHHFVRYYDASGHQIGELQVCFCCHAVRASPDIVTRPPPGADDIFLDFDHDGLGAVIRQMGYRTDIDC